VYTGNDSYTRFICWPIPE
jgi:hypothetical protein